MHGETVKKREYIRKKLQNERHTLSAVTWLCSQLLYSDQYLQMMHCQEKTEFTSPRNFVSKAFKALLILTYLTPMATRRMKTSGRSVAMQARNTVCMSEYPVSQREFRLLSCASKNCTILAMDCGAKRCACSKNWLVESSIIFWTEMLFINWL